MGGLSVSRSKRSGRNSRRAHAERRAKMYVPDLPRLKASSNLAPPGPVLFCDGKRLHGVGDVAYDGHGQCPRCRGYAVKIQDPDDLERTLGGGSVPRRPVHEIDAEAPALDRYLERN
jgi:hypothetical protein